MNDFARMSNIDQFKLQVGVNQKDNNSFAACRCVIILFTSINDNLWTNIFLCTFNVYKYLFTYLCTQIIMYQSNDLFLQTHDQVFFADRIIFLTILFWNLTPKPEIKHWISWRRYQHAAKMSMHSWVSMQTDQLDRAWWRARRTWNDDEGIF